MRIAVIGDIHANLPALRAVVEDAASLGVEAMYCVGDVVGRGPHPNEVIAELRALNVPTVQGNWDEAVAMERDLNGAGWASPQDEEAGALSLHWTADVISDDNRAWLRHLPTRERAYAEGHTLAFFHGSPRRLNEYLWSDRPSRVFARLATEESEDVLCFGHTHESYTRVVGGAQLVACGSVGCGTAGDARARYAVLSVSEPKVTVGFRSVEYDNVAVLADMAAAGLPLDLLREPPARHALVPSALSA